MSVIRTAVESAATSQRLPKRPLHGSWVDLLTHRTPEYVCREIARLPRYPFEMITVFSKACRRE